MTALWRSCTNLISLRVQTQKGILGEKMVRHFCCLHLIIDCGQQLQGWTSVTQNIATSYPLQERRHGMKTEAVLHVFYGNTSLRASPYIFFKTIPAL